MFNHDTFALFLFSLLALTLHFFTPYNGQFALRPAPPQIEQTPITPKKGNGKHRMARPPQTPRWRAPLFGAAAPRRFHNI